jgi:mannosyltransferase OCH1-like enzyme
MENLLIEKNTWLHSSQNNKLSNNTLEAELKDIHGNWKYNNLKIHPLLFNKKLDNINGLFKYDENDENVNYTINQIFPKNIFQTHKNIEFIKSNNSLNNAAESWKRHNNFKYHFYNDEQCSIFMQQMEHKFPGINEQYNRLPLIVMKADLWRYCVIYEYGGIYADTDTVLVDNPLMFININAKLIVVPENNIHMCQWVFSAPKDSPILESIIKLSLERIKNTQNIKGENIIHHLTGPGVFTDGISNYLRNQNNKITFENGYNDWMKNRKNGHDYLKYYGIHFFDYEEFHKNKVQHLFSGQWENGWIKERDLKLL